MSDPWTAIIAAGAALSGVALTQWAERRRDKARWEWESRAKLRDDIILESTKLLRAAWRMAAEPADEGAMAEPDLHDARDTLAFLGDEVIGKAAAKLETAALLVNRTQGPHHYDNHLKAESEYQAARSEFYRATKKSLGID